MTQVLDYSAGFPGAQAIQNAGYAGAVRYIGRPGNRKNATKAELQDFTAHGLGMALIFESTVTDWRGGFGGGQVSARQARDHANSIGFPSSRPLYLAVDQDVVSSVEFNVMLDYLRGAGSSLGGPGLTGVYGEADVIDRARDAGVAAWYWQTAAWSRGRRTAAHLYQHVGTVYVGGIGCDINDVLANDWGQHNAQEDDVAWSDPSGVSDPTGKPYSYGTLMDWNNRYANMIPGLHAKLDAIAGALSDDEANIIAAVRAQPTGAVVDVADLATRLSATLAPDIAAELGRRLLERNPA